MRKPVWISGCIAILVLAALVLWRFATSTNVDPAPSESIPPSQRGDKDQSVPNGSHALAPETGRAAASNVAQKEDSVKEPQVSDERTQQVETWLGERNRPIDFWGKVVDQDNNPIAGARIRATVRQWSLQSLGNVGAGGNNVDAESTADGSFAILNQRGDNLRIVDIRKDGYELSPKAPSSFNYSRSVVANPDKPVLFKMWERKAAGKLVTLDKDTRIPYDGTPVTFDLLTGEQAVGKELAGDVRITLLRTPLHVEPRQKYDWTATVEALNGGVVQSQDEFMYLAPKIGYQPRVEISVPSNVEDWTPQKELTIYVKCRGGQLYGRMTLTFRTGSDRDTTGLTIESAVNLEGSRNLQPGE